MPINPTKTTRKNPLPKKTDTVRNAAQDLRILHILAAAFFIVMMALYPLYLQDKYILLIRYKTNVYYVITVIAAALVIPFLAYNKFHIKDYFVKNEPKRPLAVHEWALLAFVLFTFISTAASKYGDVVWFGAPGRYEGFWTFLCYSASFFFVARFYRPRRKHLLIVAVGVIFVALYAALQFVGLDFLNLYPFTRTDEPYMSNGIQMFGPLSAHFRTTLGNTNVVSAYCSLSVVLVTVLYAGEKSRWRFLYLAASVLSFLMLMISNSEGGKVGILVGMALLIPYWVSGRVRLGRILTALGGWCVLFVHILNQL